MKASDQLTPEQNRIIEEFVSAFPDFSYKMLMDASNLTDKEFDDRVSQWRAAHKTVEHTEQQVLFIPKRALPLIDEWEIVSAKASNLGSPREGHPATGIYITVRKTTDLTNAQKLEQAMRDDVNK